MDIDVDLGRINGTFFRDTSTDIDSVTKKWIFQVDNVDPRMIQSIADNNVIQQEAVAGNIAEEIVRPYSQYVLPVLLTDYDNKRMSAIMELCNVLLLDIVNHHVRRNTLESQAVQQAKLLKEMKYEEADYQVAAAVVGAVISLAVSVAGGSMDINGINPANPGVLTAKSIAGQAITNLSQSINQVFSQPIAAMATRLQGDAEVVRVLKDILLNAMSSHNKMSDDQKAALKKLLEELNAQLEKQKNTTQNLINNMKV